MRRSGSLVLITVALGLFLGPPYSIGQQQPAEPQLLSTLTTAHEVHNLTLEQAARLLPWTENYHAFRRQVRLLVTKGHQRYD